MQKTIRAATLALGTFALAGFCGGAQAQYVFSNDAGGDGSISGTFPVFTITGSDNGSGSDTAFYVETSTVFETLTFTWYYTTEDSGGAVFDPAGYILNNDETQLSQNLDPGVGSNGVTTVSLKPGDVFGFYVYSQDSQFGPGILAINPSAPPTPPPPPPPAIPEPRNAALMLAGLAALFAATRRRKAD